MKGPVVLFAVILFFFSSCASITLSQNGGGGVPPCLRKLMPCVVSLHSPEKPTGACCIPLKDALENEVACLCSMFSDVGLQKSFNVTQKDLLGLPERCGLQPPDLSRCNGTARSPSAISSLDLGMSIMSVILCTLIGMSSVTPLF